MTWPAGDWRNLYFAPDKLPEILDHVARLRQDVPAGMALPELALRFILANPTVSTIIPGMRRPKHVDQNLGVSDGRPLPAELLQRLKRHRWVRTHDIP
jgi:aryl-alcohol dehydrogenase-like predicted oxidoreductase